MRIFVALTAYLAMAYAGTGGVMGQSITSIDGKKTTLKDYQGKTVLLVNIATQCGYTKQLGGLEKLYQKYKDKNLVVIGVPSNDFGGQTPEAEKEVKKFCKINYGVTFPLMAKTVVKGAKKHPLFKKLIDSSKDKEEISWNFEKFLLNKNGELIARFRSGTAPEDQELIKAIEGQL